VTVAFSVPFPVRSQDPLPVDDYLAFIADRPETERWQLIDGYALMMPPASYLHQAIGGNLYHYLRQALLAHRPELMPFYEAGLMNPGNASFRPVADLAVVQRAGLSTSYRDQYFLAAEIRSHSNTEEYLDRKRQLYSENATNLYVLILGQSERRIEVFSRASGWQKVALRALDDMLELPEFGFARPVCDIYEGTPLADPKW
jgi:Uma2 family endonuclease